MPPSGRTLTLIVKGTFRLNPNQAASPVDAADQLPLSGDIANTATSAGHYIYESDFAPFKPRADLLLSGVCHTPGGTEMRACPVTFTAGNQSKTLWVFGQRYWKRSIAGLWSMSEPEPFSQMPVTYENSFGGQGYAKNPVGRGHIQHLKKNGKHDAQAWALPAIEDTRELITSPHSKIAPPGFGPIDRMWQPRVRMAGTLDKAWLETRWPKPPTDFQWEYYNAAPKDMQVDGYLRGNEELLFENLHPEISRYRSQLPGLRARCFVLQDAQMQDRFVEVIMNTDTLWVDMEKEQVVLVWRGAAPVRNDAFKEINKLLVVTEDLSSERRQADFYWARYQADQAVTADINDDWVSPAMEENPPGDKETQSAPGFDAQDQALQEEIEKGLNQARDMLKQSDVDPDLIRSLENQSDPEVLFDTLVGGLSLDAGQIDTAREQSMQILRKLLSDQGEDPAMLDELFSSEPLAPSTDKQSIQAALIEELKRTAPDNRNFSGRDLSGLDLSGMDLSGADFSGASLDGVQFKNATLRQADFSRASLEQADFSNAALTEASFFEADLTAAVVISADLSRANLQRAIMAHVKATKANLTQADLSEANLEAGQLEYAILHEIKANGADFSFAVLTGADLRKARISSALFDGTVLTSADLSDATGKGAVFKAADLSAARMSNGCFSDANFADATMDHADLQRCDLAGATFERSRAEQIDMSGADLTGAKCGEGTCFARGRFKAVAAARSIWTDADLQGADFTSAFLERADFSRAVMTGALLRGVGCRFANFDQTILQQADISQADLFMANLTRAEMESANLSNGSFYGAEFLNAKFSKTNIQGANLKMTKLDGR